MTAPNGAEMPVHVSLEGEEEVQLLVSMGGVTSTEELLRVAFDACAETVGMELEASEGKHISLRFITQSGRERKLNTRTPWGELASASAILIKLQPVMQRCE